VRAPREAATGKATGMPESRNVWLLLGPSFLPPVWFLPLVSFRPPVSVSFLPPPYLALA
jgi:hypothetical protein